MSNKLICPFCQTELHKDPDGYYSCYTDNCSIMSVGGNGASGTESLWIALIQAKQDLETAKADIEDYKKYKALWEQIRNNTIIELERKLEIARKALEKYADEDMWVTCNVWEVDYMQGMFLEYGYKIAKEALEQINSKQD